MVHLKPISVKTSSQDTGWDFAWFSLSAVTSKMVTAKKTFVLENSASLLLIAAVLNLYSSSSSTLTFAFLVGSLHWNPVLRQEKKEAILPRASAKHWLITCWVRSTPPKVYNCSPYEMKLILCNVLMSNLNQGCGETTLKSGNISASCSKQILWF